MASNDILQRFTFDHSHVRGELVGLKQTLAEVYQRQSYPEPVNNLLGELLVAAALLSATVKIEGILSLQVQSDGPVSLLLAETRHDGQLRGIARMNELSDATEASLLGEKGQLIITIEPDQGRRYQGIVELEDGNIAKSLEGYFRQSEQLDTHLWISCENGVAAGLFLQELPALGEVQEAMDVDEDAWNRLNQLAQTLRTDELLHLDNDEILHRLFHEEKVRLYDGQPLRFNCSCSKERLSVALTQIGYAECQDIVDEQKKIRADCQFCGQHYSFTQDDVNGLFPLESAKNGKGLH
ncbi:MAG: Hsp33 family molecular chaperone HslO [Bermanella sp.]|nr:Hsp33 family molecular chaperone HslO [Bermanella sp.]|tara:strand:- start:4432 stop:5319 length:888 start_codon:yes stop_codon:yes gene_type:complete